MQFKRLILVTKICIDFSLTYHRAPKNGINLAIERVFKQSTVIVIQRKLTAG